jgi:hypothetical protein
MRKLIRPIVFALGAVLLIFGYFCLNYTRGVSERHVEFAERHQLPRPSKSIFFAGILLVATGAAAIGYRIGRDDAR